MKFTFQTLLFLFSFCSLFGQKNPQLFFKNYGTQEGLPSPEVYCVFEDSKGYLWFGTDNGICRFDGYDFRNYSAEDGLTNSVVFDIFEDKKGVIWLATLTGKIFLLDQDQITPYAFNHLIEKYRGLFTSINMVYSPQKSKVYFELHKFGILEIDNEGNDSLYSSDFPISFLALDYKDLPRMPQVQIYKRASPNFQKKKDSLGRVTDFSVTIISEEKTINIASPPLELKNVNLNKVFRSENHGQYFLFRTDQYSFLNGGDIITNHPFPFPSKLAKGKNGELWFGLLFGRGLRRYKDHAMPNSNHFDTFLEGLSITNILIDKSGGLWVTTLEKGVFYCADQNILTYNTQFGLSDDFVNTVAIKNENEVFIGCANGEIFHVDIENKTIIKRLESPTGHNTYDIYYHKESGKLWHGATYYKNGKWKRAKWDNPSRKYGPARMLTKKFVYDPIYDKILGLGILGFFSIDVKNNEMLTNSLFKNQIDQGNRQISDPTDWRQQKVYAIKIDQQKRTWIGNERGIFQLENNKLLPSPSSHPAFSSRVEDIESLPDSSIIFGTKGWGVIIWKDKKVLQISTEEGLSTNMIEDIHVDENGVIWVGTLNGLNRITFSKSKEPYARSFSISNGLPSKEIYKIASFKNQLWLCTAKGLVAFKEKPVNKQATSPIFQNAMVNNQQIDLQKDHTFLHTQNNWTFHILAINPQQDKQIPFRYRISSDDKWQETMSREINYPRLPPGDYTLEIQAQNEDRYWSVSNGYSFSIQKPWWQTWWASILFAFLLIGMGVYYIKYQNKKIQKEAAIQQQLIELERSTLQAQMNPHFIFNCLNSIQNFILKKDTDNAVRYLSQFAELIRQVLHTSQMKEITLAEEINMIENYLTLEKLRLKEKLHYQIIVDDKLNIYSTKIPPLLIQPYIENAIKYGIFTTSSNIGEVIVNYKKAGDTLVVSVKDNGAGFDFTKRPSTPVKHKSVGMSITQKRVELISQSKKNNLVDVRTFSEGETGTEITINIKL